MSTPTTRQPRRIATALRRLALIALLIPGFGGMAAAANSPLRIAVWDAATKNELAHLSPGEVLVLGEGQSVILRLYTPAGQRGSSDRTYVPGVWHLTESPGPISLSDVDQSKGSGLVRAGTAPHNRRLAAELSFRTADGRNEHGAIRVQVEPSAAAPAPVVTAPRPRTAAERAVQELYLGILVREPDAGAQSWVRELEGTAFEGLAEVAQRIANSDESRVQLYDRPDLTPQDRLAALYRHLLGLEPDRVSTTTWNGDLARIERGDVSGVVADLTRSVNFRDHFGIGQRTASR